MFGVSYSLAHVARILRNRIHARFSKPYPHDYRRSPYYKSIFFLKLYQKLGKYRLKYDVNTGNIIDLNTNKPFLIFSFDEASFQFTSNYIKVWSVEKPEIATDSTRYSCKAGGFYSLTPEGNDHLLFMENSKKETIVTCLEEIKHKNPNATIFLLIDNFSSHGSNIVLNKAKELNIDLCFLPKYSPQLQPIEKLWLENKRNVAKYKIKNIPNFTELKKEERKIILEDIVNKTFYRKVKSKNKWNYVFNNFIRKVLYKLHRRINSELKLEISI